ncbi:MAG: Extracellular ligand-binding receptor [uncultured bacterium]|uniref:Extracellular ligand-binding receptor n=1 Tax=Candidatus Wolfebacteria bacterium GW2011_GWE2_44_13 TaxID=1619017 RepID=A0A0G1K5U8_9BACT|nr:MAG: Extracellular ligand-binding receptor [uncultured bacterium]KKT43194.1 MAG: Extracellular ligand-binding receptor [Candidatus Wolfebacteria bacterium GW2011_GWE2_44_13]
MDKKRKNILRVGVIIIIVIVGLYVFVQKGVVGEVSIGVILPSTGKAANIAEDVRNGLEMAKGELTGGKKIKLVYQDDGCDPKKAISAYQFLHEVEKVNIVIGPLCSTAALVVAPLAQKDGVVMITPASATDKLSSIGDFIFRNHTHDKAELEAIAPYIKERYKKIAVIYDKTNDAYVEYDTFFKTNLGESNVVSVPVTGGMGDYKTDLLKIKAQLKDIDAVFVGVLSKDAVTLVNEMNQLGIKKQILGSKLLGTSDFVNGVGVETAEGIVYMEADYDKNTEPNFWNKYNEKFGKIPPTWVPQAYDTVKILDLAIASCGSDKSVCIKDYLHNLKDYPGAAGKLTFAANGDAIKKIAIKQVQNGQFIKISE